MSIKNEMRHRKGKKKRRFRPSVVCAYAAFLILCFAAAWMFGAFGRKKETAPLPQNSGSSNYVISESSNVLSEPESKITTSSQKSTASSVSSVTSSKTSSVAVSSKTVSSNLSSAAEVKAYLPGGDWRLIVVNKQHPLPESYKINVSYVSGNYRLDSRIADTYKQMIAAAKKDGITLNIISGFRTYQGQTSLFNNKVNSYIAKGYSKEKATELAAQYVAPPGVGEHLSGLAADIISSDWYNYNSDLNDKFDKTKEYDWLIHHCTDYGFILRYPKNKESLTGYGYEPWHYRYVGVEAAKEIMSKGLCLEEYAAKFD